MASLISKEEVELRGISSMISAIGSYPRSGDGGRSDVLGGRDTESGRRHRQGFRWLIGRKVMAGGGNRCCRRSASRGLPSCRKVACKGMWDCSSASGTAWYISTPGPARAHDHSSSDQMPSGPSELCACDQAGIPASVLQWTSAGDLTFKCHWVTSRCVSKEAKRQMVRCNAA
jgi:hypothetical protein